MILTTQRTLWDITSIQKLGGDLYTVFSPFYRKGCASKPKPKDCLPKPTTFSALSSLPESIDLDACIKISEHPWMKTVVADWDISEKGAQSHWENFLKNGLHGYKKGRNFPQKPFVSQVSPYIHFGQLSIRQLYWDVMTQGKGADRDHFISELAWREFAYYLLFHFPHMQDANFRKEFDAFPWLMESPLLKAWCMGQTGYPMVDAGMRQLYQTGYMHNRLRMLCASFLTKNLMIHWKKGEEWFWNCLFDADHATNPISWQWSSGSGTDGASYFRIFNPKLQLEKFDASGKFVKQYVPELSKVPIDYLAEPWTLTKDQQESYSVIIGKDYPSPIVDYEATRSNAADEFEQLRRNHE